MPDDLRADLRWWLTFLPHYHGVSVIPEVDWSDPDAMFACDACLSGAGVVVSGSVFPHRIPSFHSRAGHAHQRTGDADTDRGPEGLGEVPFLKEGHHVV